MDMNQQDSTYRATPATTILLSLLACISLGLGGTVRLSVLCLVFLPLGAALLGYARLVSGTPLVWLASVPAYFGAYFLDGTFEGAALTAVGVGGAVAVWLFAAKPLTKTQTLVRIAVAMGACLCGWLIVLFAVSFGAPTPTRISEVFEAGIQQLTNQIVNEFLQLKALVGEELFAGAEALLDPKQLEATIRLGAALLPGFMILLTEAAAYIALCFYRLTVRICKTPQLTADGPYYVTTSPLSAVIYTVAYVISIFTSFSQGGIGTAAVICANLTTVFAPGLLLTGLNTLRSLVRNPLFSRMRVVTIIICVALLLFLPSVLLSCIIFIGIWTTIFAWRIRNKYNHRGQ